MNLLKLLTKEIADQYIQENFKRLNDYFAEARNLVGFQFLEIRITAAGANQKIPHGLGYAPKDVLVTSTLGPAIIQFNYSEFDRTNLDVSVITGTPTKQDPAILRVYVGTHIQGNL